MEPDNHITFDSYGAVGQIQPDLSVEGGDSACWTGHYAYLTGRFTNYAGFFKAGSLGGFYRHPDPYRTFNGFGSYYRNPWDGVISRDQLTGILMGLIANNERFEIVRLTLHSLAWLGLFTYNTRINGQDPTSSTWKWPDFMPPSTWQLILRGILKGSRFGVVVKPLLWLCDLNLLLDTLRINRTEKDDVINYMGRMFVAQEIHPTFISKLCWDLLDKDHVDGRLREYWCGWRRNCGMYRLFVSKIKDLS